MKICVSVPLFLQLVFVLIYSTIHIFRCKQVGAYCYLIRAQSAPGIALRPVGICLVIHWHLCSHPFLLESSVVCLVGSLLVSILLSELVSIVVPIVVSIVASIYSGIYL